jgi:hypothetical protein
MFHYTKLELLYYTGACECDDGCTVSIVGSPIGGEDGDALAVVDSEVGDILDGGGLATKGADNGLVTLVGSLVSIPVGAGGMTTGAGAGTTGMATGVT